MTEPEEVPRMGQQRVLIVQNTPTGGPRRLGDWLHEEDLAVDVVPAFAGTPVPETLEHDGLVVLGGGYMPDDDHRAPWLAQTRTLASQALEQVRPMLGICLGGQLLAQIAGGRVVADAGAPEHGSTQIRLRAEAREDALFRDLPTIVPAIEHHVDAITELPPGAVWLASTDRCPYQAFRLGDNAWGVQFHPEVAPDRILEWDTDRLRRHGVDQERLYRQAVADDALATRTWREVTRRFAETVKGAARARA